MMRFHVDARRAMAFDRINKTRTTHDHATQHPTTIVNFSQQTHPATTTNPLRRETSSMQYDTKIWSKRENRDFFLGYFVITGAGCCGEYNNGGFVAGKFCSARVRSMGLS